MGTLGDPVENYSHYKDEITAKVGPRRFLMNGKWVEDVHKGVDIGTPVGVKILAMNDGVVTFAQQASISDTALCVAVKHDDGSTALYAHLSGYLVHKGQRVARGQVLGYTGATGNVTGPHLHLELTVNGQKVNFMDYLGPKPTGVGSIGSGEFITVQAGWGWSHVAQAAKFEDWSQPSAWQRLAAMNGYTDYRAHSLKIGEQIRVKPMVQVVQPTAQEVIEPQKENITMPQENIISLEQWKALESERDTLKVQVNDLTLERDNLFNDFKTYKDSVLEKLDSFESRYQELSSKLIDQEQINKDLHQEIIGLNNRIGELEKERDYYKAEVEVWKGKAQNLNFDVIKDLPHGKLYSYLTKWGHLALEQPINLISVLSLQGIAYLLFKYNLIHVDPMTVYTALTSAGGLSLLSSYIKLPFIKMQQKNENVIDKARLQNPDFTLQIA